MLYSAIHTGFNLCMQQYEMLSQIIYAAACLPQVVKTEEKPVLQEEFIDYCMYAFSDEVKREKEVCKHWHKVGAVQDLSGQNRYPTLTKLAKAILEIPHGNADTERLFSHVGLNKTKHRSSLGLPIFNAFLSAQFNMQVPCYNYKPAQSLLKQCNNAIFSTSS